MPYLSHLNFDTVFTAVSELLDREHLDLHPDDHEMLVDAHEQLVNAKNAVATPALREAAHELHGTDEIEIDDEGVGTSEGDGGTWVQAWVWMPGVGADGAPLELGPDDPPCPVNRRPISTCPEGCTHGA